MKCPRNFFCLDTNVLSKRDSTIQMHSVKTIKYLT